MPPMQALRVLAAVVTLLQLTLITAFDQEGLLNLLSIQTHITNTSRGGRDVTVRLTGMETMTATWSEQVAMATPSLPGRPEQSWFVPITDDQALHLTAVNTTLEDGIHQEITELHVDRDDWSHAPLALSYISEDGNIYYYRRIPALNGPLVMEDRIGQHFPPSVPFQEGDDVLLEFDVFVNSSLATQAVCVWVTYDVEGDCSSECHANISTHYLYSDWAQDTIVPDTHITVVRKLANDSCRQDDACTLTAVRLRVLIENAQEIHAGQYVCNVYTEPFYTESFWQGASFHTQTKLLYGNSTHMWPYGFALAELSVCGSLVTDGDNVTLPAGLDNCLLCYGAANPSPNVTFSKDEAPLPLTPNTFLLEPEQDEEFQAATLILRDVGPQHAGVYTCHVTNGITSSTHEIAITVQAP